MCRKTRGFPIHLYCVLQALRVTGTLAVSVYVPGIVLAICVVAHGQEPWGNETSSLHVVTSDLTMDHEESLLTSYSTIDEAMSFLPGRRVRGTGGGGGGECCMIPPGGCGCDSKCGGTECDGCGDGPCHCDPCPGCGCCDRYDGKDCLTAGHWPQSKVNFSSDSCEYLPGFASSSVQWPRRELFQILCLISSFHGLFDVRL